MKESEKELLRFALADHAFREADALAQHVIDSKMDSESHLFSASVAGIAVCYCRPFMSATGLGALTDTMQQFAGEKEEIGLRETHASLVEARHKLAAHFDRLHSEEKFKAGVLSLPPSEVRIDLRLDGYVVSTNAAYLNPQRLVMARALFAFQMQRVSERLGEFAVELLKKHKKIGEFVFQVP